MTDYNVVLLVEQAFTAKDAANLRGLHEDIEDQVVYHVLLPVEDASARVESAMGSLATGEVLSTPAVSVADADIEGLRKELLDGSRENVNVTIAAIEKAGGKAHGEPVTNDPIGPSSARSPRWTPARSSSSPARTSSASSSTSTGPPVPAASWGSRSCTCSSTRTSTSRPARAKASAASEDGALQTAQDSPVTRRRPGHHLARGGREQIAMADVLVAARVAGRGLQVSVYHPAFADLPDEARLEAAVEVLVATLGEEGLHRSVVDISPATHPPIDPFGLEPLRAFVRSLGVPVDPEAPSGWEPRRIDLGGASVVGLERGQVSVLLAHGHRMDRPGSPRS